MSWNYFDKITNNYNNQSLCKNVYIYSSDENEETEYIIFNQNNNIVKIIRHYIYVTKKMSKLVELF